MDNAEAIAPDMGEEFATISRQFDGEVDDPYAIYREHRLNRPVIEGDMLAQFGVHSQAGYKPGRPIYTLFKYADVMAVMRDGKSYTSGLLLEGLGQMLGDFMLTGMDAESHRRARGLLQPAFSPEVLRVWKSGRIEPLLRDTYVAPLAERDGCDLLADFALRFPVRVIYAILGFPDDREAVEQFAGWALRILAGPQRDPEKAAASMAAAFRAAQDLYDHILPIVARRRVQGGVGDDLISILVNAEFEGRSLSEDEIAQFVRMLLPAAAETTTRTFCNLMVELLHRPELMARIRADRSLIPRALDESMRLEPVAAFHARQTTRVVSFGGMDIPVGSALSLCIASANRDEDAYPNAESFDLGRRMRPTLAFGAGPHTCLGALVARAEIESALNALLDRFPRLQLDPDKPAPRLRGVQLRGPDAVHVRWD